MLIGKTIHRCLVYRTIVQLVERIPDKDEVDSSILSRSTIYPLVMELVDFLVLETKARKGVWVRVPPSGPNLLLDILLVVCYNLSMILWEILMCQSCKKKELDKNKKEEYNFYYPMYEDYKKYGWQYVKDKYEYPYSHPNFIQRIKKLFQ